MPSNKFRRHLLLDPACLYMYIQNVKGLSLSFRYQAAGTAAA